MNYQVMMPERSSVTEKMCYDEHRYQQWYMNAENIEEMEKLLPPILRLHCDMEAKVEDSIGELEGVYRRAHHLIQKEVYREYVRELKNRYDELNHFPDNNSSGDLPLQSMMYETLKGSGSWNNVELLLSKLPCEMARLATVR